MSVIFSDHNAMRLDINYKKRNVKHTNTWRLNNMFLSNKQVTEEIKRAIKKNCGGFILIFGKTNTIM